MECTICKHPQWFTVNINLVAQNTGTVELRSRKSYLVVRRRWDYTFWQSKEGQTSSPFDSTATIHLCLNVCRLIGPSEVVIAKSHARPLNDAHFIKCASSSTRSPTIIKFDNCRQRIIFIRWKNHRWIDSFDNTTAKLIYS
jgi:hypothetical protein